jgi:hypothetical protein
MRRYNGSIKAFSAFFRTVKVNKSAFGYLISFQRPHAAHPIAISGMLRFAEFRLDQLLTPYFTACPLWVLFKILIPRLKMKIYGGLAFFYRRVIAVMYHRFGKATEDGFDHIQKLCADR